MAKEEERIASLLAILSVSEEQDIKDVANTADNKQQATHSIFRPPNSQKRRPQSQPPTSPDYLTLMPIELLLKVSSPSS